MHRPLAGPFGSGRHELSFDERSSCALHHINGVLGVDVVSRIGPLFHGLALEGGPAALIVM